MKIKLPTLQGIVHLGAWLLVAWLIFDYLAGNLSINPIQDITQRTGRYAIAFLVLSLAATPVNTLTGFHQVIKVRRTLGLYAFMFASIHFLFFSGVDYRFDWITLIDEVITKPYILIGVISLTILLTLAITSLKWWMKKMGKNWKRLHTLVYLAGVTVVIHYAWAVKGDVLSLQGDIIKPLLYGLAVIILLALRVPSIRRRASQLRYLRKSRLPVGDSTL